MIWSMNTKTLKFCCLILWIKVVSLVLMDEKKVKELGILQFVFCFCCWWLWIQRSNGLFLTLLVKNSLINVSMRGGWCAADNRSETRLQLQSTEYMYIVKVEVKHYRTREIKLYPINSNKCNVEKKKMPKTAKVYVRRGKSF